MSLVGVGVFFIFFFHSNETLNKSYNLIFWSEVIGPLGVLEIEFEFFEF